MTQIARIRDAQISNGNVINADDIDAEFNQLVNESNSQDTRLTDIEDENLTLGGVKTFSDQAVFSSGFKTDTITPVSSGGATAITLAGAGVNAQTGTTYTVVTGDRYKLVTLSNASPVAVTLPQAGSTGFANNFEFEVKNIGAGTVTITPTTSTIDGAATLTLTNGQSVRIYGDNTNYFSSKGKSDPTGRTTYSGSAASEAEITFGTADKYRLEGWIRVGTDARNIAVQFSDGSYKTSTYKYANNGREDDDGSVTGVSTSAAAILINGDTTVGNASGEHIYIDMVVSNKGSTNTIFPSVTCRSTIINTSGGLVHNSMSGAYTGALADMTKMKLFSETGGAANGTITYSLVLSEIS